MGANSLPKTVARQRPGCDLNRGPSAPESSTLTTRLQIYSGKELQKMIKNHVQYRGCSPKTEVGGRLKQDLDKDFFKQFRPTYTYTHTRQKIATADLWSCSAIQLLVFECL